MNYFAYGIVLGTDVALPELKPSHESPLLTFSRSRDPLPADGWRCLRPPSDATSDVWLAVAVGHGGYRLRFDGSGEFFMSADARVITTHAAAGDIDDATRHLLIDQVVPLALSHMGRFVLHASAFAANGAVALTGPAGAGKSTLAASFGSTGVPVVSDDALVVERERDTCTVAPAYAGLRVWPDVLHALECQGNLRPVAAYSEKGRLGPDQGLTFATGRMPLRRVYLLQREGSCDIGVRRLSAREAAVALISHTYLLDAADRRGLHDHFTRVCTAFPLDVRALMYPENLSALPAVRRAVLADLDS